MNEVEVEKSKLIETLHANRRQHMTTFAEASANYRTSVVLAMRDRADAIAGGAEIDTHFELPKPEDHTEDYDEAIQQLEWDRQSYVKLDTQQFRQWVLDKWRWELAFLSNTASYTGNR